VAGRPRMHSTNFNSHKTKDEIAQRELEEKAASDFSTLTLSPPSWIDSEAQKEYRRVAPMLKKLSITALDRQVLIDYCIAVSTLKKAIKAVEENGVLIDGKKNPAVNVMLDMQKEIRANASSLGMTLDSRMKLVKPEPKDEIEDDPYAKFGE
jgi:putative phage terminase, small subunit, P27 family